MKKIAIFFILASYILLFSGCRFAGTDVAKADYRVVPLPREIINDTTGGKCFQLSGNTVIFFSEKDGLRQEAAFLQEYLFAITKTNYKVQAAEKAPKKGIWLTVDKDVCHTPESYRIDITEKRIVVSGADAAGVFYAVQTLRKSIPAMGAPKVVDFPCGTVSDFPEFAYRGMMLDVSRHFFPIDSVKIYLDMMALHNINTFHWHLTDDQGWRIEIDKYPRLTEVGAWRDGTTVGRNTNKYDSIRHGGFYTKAQLREIVEYAAARHITVIPEFDLPGHTQSLLAAYPQFGCTGGPYQVWQRWGVTDEVVCAGNEEAMCCLEDILNEIMDIFPSEIIHIGGDECPKTRWRECQKCQAKIRELGLDGKDGFSAEDHLQSYVMNRMERTVNARGRRIMGWDEILEGSISPMAMVMSWRGTKGGIEAANKGHDVVMTPADYLYFSQGQSLYPENEPVFADGYLPVEKVYSFNPLPDELNENAKQHVIGVQANIWGEYAPYFSHVEYDALPRMAALAEIQWRDNNGRNYQDFLDRCYKMTDIYRLCGYNFATHIFDIQADVNPDYENKCINIKLSHYGDGNMLYTLDGTNPENNGMKYTEPIEIRDDADFNAVLVRDNGKNSRCHYEFRFSKSSMKPVLLKEQPHPNYAYQGAQTLVDGLHGNKNYRTGRWIGFWGTPLEAVINLQQPTEISRVSFNAQTDINDWIYNPKSFAVFVSNDGKKFTKMADDDYPLAEWDTPNGIYNYSLKFAATTATFVKVVITGHDLPRQHTGYGNPAWLFVDEIEIE